MNENKEKKGREEVLNIKYIQVEDIRIPDCCREGWANCPHVIRQERRNKTNVGL